MKLTMERSALNKALGAIKGATERRNTIPILANVLLEAADKQLTCLGTDLDLAFSANVAAEVEKPGRVTVEAATLRGIVGKLDAKAHVVVALEGDKLIVKSGRARFSLNTLPADDFPSLEGPKDSELTRFTVPANELARLFGKSQFAISAEETRYYLNGVYFHATQAPAGHPKKLRSVATDGHRLAQIEADCPEGAESMPGVIVPRKTVNEALKLATDNQGGSIEVLVSDKKIVFRTSDYVITSKLIDGTFPDYTRVVPLGNDKRATVDRADLSAAADRVTTVSSERGRAVKLSWVDGKLTLSVVNPDAGSAQEEMEVEYDSEPLEIGFNSHYIGSVLEQIDEERVNISLADPGSPTLFRPINDSQSLYVLMPMRV
jgi:DNA polymerase-3 subunit beta